MTDAPALLTAAHGVASFSCGQPSLDEWLQKRALANEGTSASRTYVLTEHGRVTGYYALAAGSIALAEAPGKIRRNMPDPIPLMILGRLAIDQTCQGRGLGKDLLCDAVLRTVQAAGIAGIRALLVHALDDKAETFYVSSGFLASPLRPLTLFLPLHPLAGR